MNVYVFEPDYESHIAVIIADDVTEAISIFCQNNWHKTEDYNHSTKYIGPVRVNEYPVIKGKCYGQCIY